MADTLNVITICGSLRKGSLNASVMRTLPSLAPAGMTITPAPSWAAFPVYNADDQNEKGIPQDVTALAEAIRAADGVVVVSPEYNWSIPGPLKNAIDWLSRLKEQPFKFKPLALQSASGSPVGASRMQYHLRQSLNSLEALIMNRPEVIITFAPKKIDEAKGVLTDEATLGVIKQQLDAFGDFIRRVRD